MKENKAEDQNAKVSTSNTKLETALKTPPVTNPNIQTDSSNPDKSIPPAIQKTRNKWLKIAFIVVALLVLGTVGFIAFQNSKLRNKQTDRDLPAPTTETSTLTPTPDPTANWETYTNDYWSIVIKYPSNYLTPCQDYTSTKEGIRFFSFGFSCPKGTDNVYKIGIVGYEPNKYAEYKTPVNMSQINLNGIAAQRKSYAYQESDGPLFAQMVSQEVVLTLDKGTLVLQQWGGDPEDKLVFDQILSTFKFLAEQPTTTQTPPNDWKLNTFNGQNISIYLPNDWTSSLEDFPEIPSSLIRMKKSSWNYTPVQLDIKTNWDNTGNAKDLAKDIFVGGNIPAVKSDPPRKNEQTLDRYQTNVYFEHGGKVYVFTCIHNWDNETLNTCNQILNYISFND